MQAEKIRSWNMFPKSFRLITKLAIGWSDISVSSVSEALQCGAQLSLTFVSYHQLVTSMTNCKSCFSGGIYPQEMKH